MRWMSLCAAAVLSAAALAGCDRSAQNADGAVEAGDPGVAATTTAQGGPMADTGRDNAGADVGGAGQVAEPGGATDAGDATSPKSQ